MNLSIFSGFADEASPVLTKQLELLHELQIPHIELRGVDGKNISELTLEETKALHQRLEEAKITVSAIGSPLGKIKISDDFDAHLKVFDHVMKQAEILETKNIRMFSFYESEGHDDEVYRRIETFLKHTPSGFTLLHENEKGIFGYNTENCLELMSRFYSDAFQATFDPANFIQEQVVPMDAYEALSPYVAYVHVKDALFEDASVVPAGMGDAEWPMLLRYMRVCGYEGIFSMEPHLVDFTGFSALEQKEDAAEPAGSNNAESSEEDEAVTKWKLAFNTFKELYQKVYEGEEARYE